MRRYRLLVVVACVGWIVGFHSSALGETRAAAAGRTGDAAPATQPSAAAMSATRPAPPAWIAREPAQWPRILLSNRVVGRDNSFGDSGSSSLVRLPDGVVVLFTARHLLGGARPGDFPSAFKSWTAYATNPSSGTRMTRTALDPDQPASLDALVLCPASQSGPWPATVLPVRQQPLAVGERVYLVAVPGGQSREHQQVFKGQLVAQMSNKQFEYDVDGGFDTMGCSGAPVIDEYGQLAAINVGHLLTQTVPGKRQLTCVPAIQVLGAIRLPPDVHPIAVRPTPAAPPATDAPNTEAERQLKIAKLYVQSGRPKMARPKLEAIIRSFPHDPAAAEAKKLLATFPDD